VDGSTAGVAAVAGVGAGVGVGVGVGWVAAVGAVRLRGGVGAVRQRSGCESCESVGAVEVREPPPGGVGAVRLGSGGDGLRPRGRGSRRSGSEGEQGVVCGRCRKGEGHAGGETWPLVLLVPRVWRRARTGVAATPPLSLLASPAPHRHTQDT
jgi:hypothetical protein